MSQGMRRGTPSAELFGGLLAMIRIAGTANSMRKLGEKIGAPAATVSQIEKGQRALKEPKIAIWSGALDVNEADLLELWWLSQGQVLVGRGRVFYAKAGDGLGTEALKPAIAKELERRPDLESVYRLAELIAAILKRILPNANVQVDPPDFEPLHIDKMTADIPLTAEQEDKQAEHEAAFVPLPWIECYWDSTPKRQRPREINARYRVQVPLLEEFTPIVRRRSKSVDTVELENLIHDLSGPERERVRGYVEAIVEQRGSST